MTTKSKSKREKLIKMVIKHRVPLLQLERMVLGKKTYLGVLNVELDERDLVDPDELDCFNADAHFVKGGVLLSGGGGGYGPPRTIFIAGHLIDRIEISDEE